MSFGAGQSVVANGALTWRPYGKAAPDYEQ